MEGVTFMILSIIRFFIKYIFIVYLLDIINFIIFLIIFDQT